MMDINILIKAKHMNTQPWLGLSPRFSSADARPAATQNGFSTKISKLFVTTTILSLYYST